ncbi:hypothetical protein Drorol1_Dr00013759 [Drosera rotundifolia]
MLAADTPAGHQIHRPKIARKPLRTLSINELHTPSPKSIPKQIVTTSTISSFNEENELAAYKTPPPPPPPAPTSALEYSLNSSLAEELSAVREKLERLRIDKERTDVMLRERHLVLDSNLKEVLRRGEVQKDLEIELDRLYRLKQLLHLTCLRMSPIRSLRAREMDKKHPRAHNTQRFGSGCKIKYSHGSEQQTMRGATVKTASKELAASSSSSSSTVELSH